MARKTSWSWKIGSVFGIAVRVHATLLVLLGWVAVAHFAEGAGAGTAALGVALIAVVFAIIVVHELAHALVARRFGCRTREILLLPIGGIAQMDRTPERPVHELLVAVAGPAVNVILAGLLAVGIVATGGSIDPEVAMTATGSFATQLLWINVSLAVFNLLPAFPMDGGRVFRAVLAIWIGRDRATRIASRVGRALGGVFVFAGLMYSPMLAIVGVFVWLAARQESANLEMRSLLAGTPVRLAMISPPPVVDARDSVATVADHLLQTGQRELAVVDDGRLVGLVTVAELATALGDPRAYMPVGAVARALPEVSPDDQLDQLGTEIERAGGVFVLDRGTLVGLVTPEQLAIYAAFRASHRVGPTRPPVAVRPAVTMP